MSTTATMRLTFEDGPAEGLDIDVDRAPTGPPRYVYVAVAAGKARVVGRMHEQALVYWRQHTDHAGGTYKHLPLIGPGEG